MLEDLVKERERLDDAILAMEHLAVYQSGKRRGRPSKLMVALRAKHGKEGQTAGQPAHVQ